jgi:hypothetical protein
MSNEKCQNFMCPESVATDDEGRELFVDMSGGCYCSPGCKSDEVDAKRASDKRVSDMGHAEAMDYG